MGMSGWQARKKSYNRTTCLKSDRTCPNQVISQLRAKMVPTSALGAKEIQMLGALSAHPKSTVPSKLSRTVDRPEFPDRKNGHKEA